MVRSEIDSSVIMPLPRCVVAVTLIESIHMGDFYWNGEGCKTYDKIYLKSVYMKTVQHKLLRAFYRHKSQASNTVSISTFIRYEGNS